MQLFDLGLQRSDSLQLLLKVRDSCGAFFLCLHLLDLDPMQFRLQVPDGCGMFRLQPGFSSWNFPTSI